MNRTKLRDRPTLWVVRKLLRATAQADARHGPTAILQPWAWLTRSRVPLFEERKRAMLKEIMIRYRGVINEVLFLHGITSRDEVQGALARIGRSFYADIYKIDNAEMFSAELWRAVERTGVQPNAQVKRKFMLRQFVENVPKRKGRDTLRRLAFERVHGAPAPTVKDLTVLKHAYPCLHRALAKWSSRLGDMTDNTVRLEMISGFVPPYVEYEAWLFENDDDPTV